MIIGGVITLIGKIIALNVESVNGNLLIITGFILNAFFLFRKGISKMPTV
jgi:hypothetical protein